MNGRMEAEQMARQHECQDQPPCLTAMERQVIEASREFWQVEADAFSEPMDQQYADVLRGLLERMK